MNILLRRSIQWKCRIFFFYSVNLLFTGLHTPLHSSKEANLTLSLLRSEKYAKYLGSQRCGSWYLDTSAHKCRNLPEEWVQEGFWSLLPHRLRTTELFLSTKYLLLSIWQLFLLDFHKTNVLITLRFPEYKNIHLNLLFLSKLHIIFSKLHIFFKATYYFSCFILLLKKMNLNELAPSLLNRRWSKHK